MSDSDVRPAGAPIIELQSVSFAYGDADENTPRALDDVSLTVRQGDFVGVIGPSGAGKSTLASVMSGAIPHHFSGQLFGATLVDGKDTCDVTLTDISRLVGSVLQDIDTQMVASVVEDEMLFGLENFGVPHDQIEARVAETLETVGIADLREREIATLSGGQKQKVAIAAILALRPRVLVLDEPTAALDPASSRLVFDTLRHINESQGVTVVVIEQKVALLSEYCNRVAVLDHGHLAIEGTPHEVFARGDELRRIGVDSPRVARIANSLAQKGLVEPGDPCLNVPEAEALISGLVSPFLPDDLSHSGAVGEKSMAVTGGAAAPDSAAAADAAPASGRVAPEKSPHAPARPKADGAKPVVTFRDVTFAYPGGGASVRNLELMVYPGELVGIVGQNGAGKTTLTKLLNGLLKPSKGEVCVAGLGTREVPTSKIAAHCATLFQNPDRQLCRDTVLDEVAFGLELQGVPAEEARGRARAVAERFGLSLDEAPFSLSRGQRQMVALASVVVIEPDVIVLDEPTSGLDYRECMTVMQTVGEMAEKGCAVIMVCHDMEVVSDFAERIVVMANGEILDRGDARTLFADADLMRRASVAPPQVIELSGVLARDVSPRFAGISEVSDIVDVTEEMVRRG
ncbi:ABC transporter ATP-binding protein [Olsenella uli]|uniref:ABC transporter ATP-binding protein n=1 Tax=Olsenella uli TaxID=133926 RepID=UPI0021C86D0A|nr:energy-coupling factor transporter ATPase [Olsenella uli]